MMVLGFVVIWYPERYISHPDESFYHQQTTTERFTNETTRNISAALNISEVEHNDKEKISVGAIEKDSDEDFHYLERLKDLQDEGVEGRKFVATCLILLIR